MRSQQSRTTGRGLASARAWIEAVEEQGSLKAGDQTSRYGGCGPIAFLRECFKNRRRRPHAEEIVFRASVPGLRGCWSVHETVEVLPAAVSSAMPAYGESTVTFPYRTVPYQNLAMQARKPPHTPGDQRGKRLHTLDCAQCRDGSRRASPTSAGRTSLRRWRLRRTSCRGTAGEACFTHQLDT